MKSTTVTLFAILLLSALALLAVAQDVATPTGDGVRTPTNTIGTEPHTPTGDANTATPTGDANTATPTGNTEPHTPTTTAGTEPHTPTTTNTEPHTPTTSGGTEPHTPTTTNTEPHTPTASICTSQLCGTCISDARCGFCRVTASAGVSGSSFCRALAPDSTESASVVCANHQGTLVQPGGQCETGGNTVATPAEATNTDTICHQRDTCDGCFERSECGICTFLSGLTACRATSLTVAGETGPDFCNREKGTWSVTKDICTAAATVGAVNNGDVTQDDVNNDLTTSGAGATNGYIVVVTLITQANAGADGSAHFQTFVDVTGNAQPTADDEKAICHAISESLAKHLNVTAGVVSCDLTFEHSKKRTTFSYVADMTVGGPSSLTGMGALAVPMVLLTVFAAILSVF